MLDVLQAIYGWFKIWDLPSSTSPSPASLWSRLLSVVSINLLGVFQSHKNSSRREKGKGIHLSTFLKLGVVRSSSFELLARLMNASSPTCVLVLLYYWIILLGPHCLLTCPSSSAMPGTTPSSRSTCQKTLRTDFCPSLSPTLLHYCTVVFCLFCIWMICRWICDLVDPVDVFHLLYRDPHISIRVPLLHLIITICFFCLTLDNIEFLFKSFLNILLKQDFKISPKFRMDFSRTIDFFRILESF